MRIPVRLPSNTPPAKDPRDLWRHFSDTYFSLRVGLAALAFAFPLALYGYGKLRYGLDLQPSMSAYFWAALPDQCATFPMRTVFVGFLIAIGVGLYLYKGITSLENWLLNAAGICAALVALFPERLSLNQAKSDLRVAELFERCPAVQAWASQPSLPVHYIAAVALFLLLAIVAWACADKTLEYLPKDVDAMKYRRLYRSLAVGMVTFPIPGVLVAWVLGLAADWIFFVEAAGIATFGAYWAVKSRELSLSQLEKDPRQAVLHAEARAGKEASSGAGNLPPGNSHKSLPGGTTPP
jgi:hypothetical protein